jgi:integrase
MIETGARPSEICNLRRSQIVLDHEVPHIAIAPLTGKGERREIKSRSSVRKVPLVGVSLAAMQAQPDGFPRYFDQSSNLSANLMKYFRARELFPSDEHTIYSLRHSFEDRMKEGGLDDELRRTLMGHTIDRPKYGAGGALRWRRDQLRRIVLPFDPAVV